MPKRDYAPALAVATLIAAILCALLGGCAACPP